VSSAADAIAEALAALGEPPPAPLDNEDILLNFLARLMRNGATVEAVRGRAEAVQSISDFLYREHNTRKVVAGYDARLAAMPWRVGGVLVRFGAAVAADPVSISHARLAVAESGSLVFFANKDNPACNNWLVTDHLAVVDGKDLVASYEEAWNRIRELTEEGLPRGINFISGPSNTADIALHTVVGAHGPQRLHVICIGETGPDLMDRADSLARDLVA